MRRAPGRRWLGRIGLTLGGLVFGLVAAELVLRVMGAAPERFEAPRAVESADKRWALDLYPDDPADRFPLDLADAETRAVWTARVPDAAPLVDSHPHAVPLHFDRSLCRVHGPGDGAQVVVVGDSFTEGQGVEGPDTFSALLDTRLEARVLGCGRRGLDFPRLSERFDAVVSAHEPDVVLYAMVLNDIVRSEAFHARQRFVDDWIVNRRRQVESFEGVPDWPPRLVQLVSDRIEGRRIGAETTRWYREMVGPDNAEGWRETVRRVAAMSARLQGRFMVAIWPLLVSLESYPFEEVHRTICEALREEGVEVVDTLPAFAGRDASELWVHPADRHPNREAHALFATAVEGPLSRLLESAAAAPPGEVNAP